MQISNCFVIACNIRRKKQRGGFLPILGTLAKSLLLPSTGSIVGEILKGLGSKIFDCGTRSLRRRRQRPRRITYA